MTPDDSIQVRVESSKRTSYIENFPATALASVSEADEITNDATEVVKRTSTHNADAQIQLGSYRADPPSHMADTLGLRPLSGSHHGTDTSRHPPGTLAGTSNQIPQPSHLQQTDEIFSSYSDPPFWTDGMSIQSTRFSMTSRNANNVDARGGTFVSIGRDQIFYNVDPLNTLPYAEGASWSPALVCLTDTRTALLNHIWTWISNVEGRSAEIMWLSDVAGSGKTAIAHSVSQRCHEEGILGSSFFFNREIPDRNRPQKLFSTITRDLTELDKDVAEHIRTILEDNRSLACAPQSRQFDELILTPWLRHHHRGPVVVVMDGLDEGYDLETLEILRKEVPKLPGTFRILLTSRPKTEIDVHLSDVGHVRRTSIDIHSDVNRRDITVYTRNRLQFISSGRHLGADWPDSQVAVDLTKKSEGLFIWVSTVCNYLCTTTYPDKKLRSLLYQHHPSDLRAEENMDKLYAEILDSCDWRDDDFVDGYKLVIGAIMTAKMPLSSSALQSLHRLNPALEVIEILHPLSSLFTGLTGESQPIQMLHLSFRDFITYRALLTPTLERFYISEEEHNQRLGFLCLRVMNEDLKPDIPGTGYLAGYATDHRDGIPKFAEADISEVLWYACRCWINHVLQIKHPVSEMVLGAFRTFLSMQLVTWLEVLVSKYQYQRLDEVREWLQGTISDSSVLVNASSSPYYATVLAELSFRLSNLGRREDSLGAAEESVRLLRRHAADDPAAFIPDLGCSLIDLSNRLSDLGHREESLDVIKEAVELYRPLAANHPEKFIPDLAISLNNLSLRLSGLGNHKAALEAMEEVILSLHNLSAALSKLGRRQEALEPIEEAVKLQRQLSADRPAIFIPDLEASLNDLSNRLGDLGRREESLQVIKETVELARQLAADHPAKFIPRLAISLNNFSLRLSELGHREAALEAIEEVIPIRRRLAAAYPALSTCTLAESLGDLSAALSALGRRHEALEAIEESVKLQRQLAADRPAVFISDLSMSLNDLSMIKLNVGHREQSLEVMKEAAELCRKCFADDPSVYMVDFSICLNNFSFILSNLGLHEEALRTIEQALPLRQRLAADCPIAFVPRLAISLYNKSCSLSNLGHWEESLEIIEEGVKLYRELVENQPAVFTPNLAMALDSLSSCLSRLGHKRQALEMIEEAVMVRRRLADDHPAAFIPDLAESLNNHSLRLSDLDRHEEATKVIKEGVKLRRVLATDCPAAFIPDLARSLNNLCRCLSSQGHNNAALPLIEEAIELLRPFANELPAAFNSDLAKSLITHSISLSRTRHHEGALAVVEEALRLQQQLSVKCPADLAMSLSHLSSCLSDLGRQEDALRTMEDVVTLRRQLAADYPAAFTSELATSLIDLSNLLFNLGQQTEALEATSEADLLRQDSKLSGASS